MGFDPLYGGEYHNPTASSRLSRPEFAPVRSHRLDSPKPVAGPGPVPLEADTSALGQVVSQPRIQRASGAAWFSFLIRLLAWMFDAMDLTIFTRLLLPSVSELIVS